MLREENFPVGEAARTWESPKSAPESDRQSALQKIGVL